MVEACICDFTRSAFGRYAGALRDVSTGDLVAHPIRALMQETYRTNLMPETGENLAEQFQNAHADQDKFVFNSQMRAIKAQDSGFFEREITPVTIKGRKGDLVAIQEQHPRHGTRMALLVTLKTPYIGVGQGIAALVERV